MRNSERGTFRRCRLKWYWAYEKRLNPPRQKGALTFGTLVHEALAEYYIPGRKRGPKPAGIFEKLFTAEARQFQQYDEDGDPFDALELGVAMLESYVKEYGEDDHIEIIAPEIPLQVDVFDSSGRYLCTWVGRGDAAYIDHSRTRRGYTCVGLLEHKTAKSVPSTLSIISGYGDQGHSYWWAASLYFRHHSLLPAGAQVDHVMFNWLKKAMPSTKPRNAQGHILNKPTKESLLAKADEMGLYVAKKPTVDQLIVALEAEGVDTDQLGEPSKRQPTPLLFRDRLDYGQREHEAVARRIRQDAREMEMVRKGKLAIVKNPTKDCDWDCPFKSACELHEMGEDYESVLELEFTQWNPYDDHELSEEKGR